MSASPSDFNAQPMLPCTLLASKQAGSSCRSTRTGDMIARVVIVVVAALAVAGFLPGVEIPDASVAPASESTVEIEGLELWHLSYRHLAAQGVPLVERRDWRGRAAFSQEVRTMVCVCVSMSVCACVCVCCMENPWRWHVLSQLASAAQTPVIVTNTTLTSLWPVCSVASHMHVAMCNLC